MVHGLNLGALISTISTKNLFLKASLVKYDHYHRFIELRKLRHREVKSDGAVAI